MSGSSSSNGVLDVSNEPHRDCNDGKDDGCHDSKKKHDSFELTPKYIEEVSPPYESNKTTVKQVLVKLHGIDYELTMCVGANDKTIAIQAKIPSTKQEFGDIFSASTIESICDKSGYPQTYLSFCNIMKIAFKEDDETVRFDILSYNDLVILKNKKNNQKQQPNNNHAYKRYFIITCYDDNDNAYRYILTLIAQNQFSVHELISLRKENKLLKEQIYKQQQQQQRQQQNNNNNNNNNNDNDNKYYEVLYKRAIVEMEALMSDNESLQDTLHRERERKNESIIAKKLLSKLELAQKIIIDLQRENKTHVDTIDELKLMNKKMNVNQQNNNNEQKSRSRRSFIRSRSLTSLRSTSRTRSLSISSVSSRLYPGKQKKTTTTTSNNNNSIQKKKKKKIMRKIQIRSSSKKKILMNNGRDTKKRLVGNKTINNKNKTTRTKNKEDDINNVEERINNLHQLLQSENMYNT